MLDFSMELVAKSFRWTNWDWFGSFFHIVWMKTVRSLMGAWQWIWSIWWLVSFQLIGKKYIFTYIFGIIRVTTTLYDLSANERAIYTLIGHWKYCFMNGEPYLVRTPSQQTKTDTSSSRNAYPVFPCISNGIGPYEVIKVVIFIF